MRIFLAAVVLALTASCASVEGLKRNALDLGVEGYGQPIRRVEKGLSEGEMTGTYSHADGFWSWELHLEADHSFALVWISDSLIVEADGACHLESGTDVSGTWRIEDASVVLSFGRDEAFRLVRVGGRLSLVEPKPRVNRHRVYIRTDSPMTKRLRPTTPNPEL